jgi:hypothetical protein
LFDVSDAERDTALPSTTGVLTPGAQYCTGIGKRKVHHLWGW